MFHYLLKKGKPKGQQQLQSHEHNWHTPHSKFNQQDYPSEEDQQTPGFLNKLDQISRKIQMAEEGFSQDFQNDYKHKNLETEEINDPNEEERHPMILSNINSLRPGVNKLICLRLRNTISEMKQTYFDLAEYLQDQRKLMADFHQRMCRDVENFCSHFTSIAVKESSQAEIQHLKTQNTILRQKIERREAEYQRLNKDLMRKPELVSDTQPIICSTCNQLQNKLARLNEELRRSEKEMQRLAANNEELQEHIFDIQQKIAGVDLQVERRLKQKLLLLPQHYKKSPPKSSDPQELQLLKEEIHLLQTKCKKMQEKLKIKGQIDISLEKLHQIQEQLQRSQLVLNEVQQKSEDLRQVNYQRQQQILQAQENLSKKINDIRSRQADLSSWEAELTRKQSEIRKADLQPKIYKQQNSYRINGTDEPQLSRELSLRSFGRVPREVAHQEEFGFQTATYPRRKVSDNVLEQEIRKQPHMEQYQPNYGLEKRTTYTKNHVEKQHSSKNRDNLTIYVKKPNLAGSHYKDSRENSPYRTIPEQRSRGLQQVGSRNAQYRDLSKNSRHSAAKSNKNGHNFTINPPKVTNQSLGLKLQRLREQIKKEIQSIK